MKRIEIEDLYQYKFLSKLNYSDDGKSCVFVLSEMDKKNNGYKSFLYLYRNGKIRQLTSVGKETSFIFKNNNELYLFTSRSDEEKKDTEALRQFTPVYSLLLDGGEAVKAFELPIRASMVKKIDDEYLLISSFFDKEYPDYYKMSDKQKAAVNKKYLDNRDYEEFDEVPFYFNGMGYTKNMRNGLFLYNMKKKSVQRITDPKFSVGSFEVINNRIYYSGNAFDYIRSRKDVIKYYDLKNKKTYKVLDDKYTVYSMVKFNDEIIVMINRHLKHGLNEDAILYRLNPKNNKLTVFNDEDRSYGNSSGSDCRYSHGRSFKAVNDRLYFLETRNYSIVLAYFDKKGNKHDVYTAEGSIDDFEIFEDKIILNILKPDALQELYLLKDNNLKQLTHFNSNILKNKYVAVPRHETVRSAKYKIDGWVLYPKDYDSRKKYPAVLDIHGGPKTIYGEIFYHEMQVWANRGYFVFYCNPFGSDGRGNSFMDIRGKYGTVDYKNIMDFTDHVLNKYKNIDKKRVCVTGGSYGGFMTNWIVGHTDRFVCAATQRSISNWISFYGTSDIGVDFALDQCAADLNNLEKLWNHSPLKYVDNVKTPILFIHSDEDYRCPLEQGMQYYTSITKNKVPAKMVVFHGENHELSRSGKPHHRIKRLSEITNWFEKYAK